MPSSPVDPARTELARRLFAAMGLVLIAYGMAIVYLGHFTIHGKHTPKATTYTGTAAWPWAAMFACFGIALLGTWRARGSALAVWMGLWLMAGIAAVLVPAFIR